MSSWKKLKLLVWKNFLLQKRHKWQTLFEIASPVIFSMFLILVRCLVNPTAMPETHYEPFKPTNVSFDKLEVKNLTKTIEGGTVAFSPNSTMIRQFTKDVMTSIAMDNLEGFFALIFNPSMLPEPEGYDNAIDMEKALMKPGATDKVLVGVQFDDGIANATEWPDDIKVTIRFPAIMRTPLATHPLSASWRTNLLFPLFVHPGPREPKDSRGGFKPGYSPELFLAVQHAVSRELIRQKSGKNPDIDVYLRRYPHLSYRSDRLIVAMEQFISMIIMLCFAYTFVNTVRVVTAEKELQLKETMTIMGLSSWIHWAAWFIKQFSFISISAVIMVILFKIPFNQAEDGEGYSVLTYTHWTVILLFMILFVISSLTFSFMVSVFFSSANTAASFMGLSWFMTYSAYAMTQILYEEVGLATKCLLCLISNTAMGFACQMMVTAEGTGQGLQWNNLFTPLSYQDNFVPGHVFLLMIFDSILYMMIAFYVEKIRPGIYGVPLPWYFPFTKRYWLPRHRSNNNLAKGRSYTKDTDSLLKVIHDEEPRNVPVGVDIKNLTKIYKGRKPAVDELNLRVYRDEITVLLGHNGAGKTTTISMLTGTVPPTSGTALINGWDVVTATAVARRSLGVCPQHNVLFPDLTTAEHIYFYSALKGTPANKLDEEVDQFLRRLDLEAKRDVLSSHLSGGQKRRLSVGVAMCGSSTVVLLDEPTSGLDPAARRALWDLLQREKKGRSIILSTHFMDEADVLGDRIAILSGGRLQCVGTPYFLKKYYGLGYKITIVKGANCDTREIAALLHSHVPETKENTNIGSELTYILPSESASKFPSMLKELEDRRESLGISSYGLSATTLEEVFMKAGAEDRSNEFRVKSVVGMSYKNGGNSGNGSVGPVSTEINYAAPETLRSVRGFQLLRNHIKAMFLKLMYNCLRTKFLAFIQIVSPIINICLSVIISRSWKFMTSLPPLELSLRAGFPATETLMSAESNLKEDSLAAKAMTAYKDYFKGYMDPKMKVNDIGTGDISQRYLKMMQADPASARYEVVVGSTWSASSVTAWFSNYGYHDSAVSLATVDRAIMRALSPNTTLSIVNHPLPYSLDTQVKVMAAGSGMGFQFAFNIGFCMAFVCSFLIIFVIKERTSGSKLLQRVSGVQPGVMWSSALVWDLLWLNLVNGAIVATLAVFQELTLSTSHELGRVFLVLLVFSFCVVPVHYVASFWFDAPATGFSKMCFINIFTGCMPFLIQEVLRLREVGNPVWADVVDYLFSPLPIYCLCRSFRELSMIGFTQIACDNLCSKFITVSNCTRSTLCDKMKIDFCCMDRNPYFYFFAPGIGRYLLAMFLVGLGLFGFLLFKEYRFWNKVNLSTYALPKPHADEDEDVAAERERVKSMSDQQRRGHSLVAQDLTKYYTNFLAVDRLTLGVSRSTCFGLLGINGAGKTTTFRMLVGDTSISAGDVYVHGLSVRTQLRDVHSVIGYCPQFDALLENLTARETLKIFCLLRGIPASVGKQQGLYLAQQLGFITHYDKKVSACSGGTKRKISTAVALLGNAPLVFLDEPTTGMDPASKRLVWSCISSAVTAGRSVVLTSHSMEECEALCSRLTIMVNGRPRCLGPLQHLKNKYSQGYTVIVKCKSVETRDVDVAAITQFIIHKFPEAKMIETYLGITTYYVNDVGVSWWKVFEVLEEAHNQFPIEDYSVSQTTLEQVFLQFTRMQGTHEEV